MLSKTRFQRVLITGGAGCIGSDLAASVANEGTDVVVVDDLSSGRLEHLHDLVGKPNFQFIKGDLRDTRVVEQSLDGVDMVYHLAANPDIKFQLGDPVDKDLKLNTLITHGLLDAIAQRGIKHFAFASSSAVYGVHEKLPISEEAVCRPISLYGASKLACEGFIHSFANLFEIQCWIFRFANVVGDKVRARGRTVIGDFVAKLNRDPRQLSILGNGRQAKSYMLSSECVDAMRFVVANATDVVNVYNLGGTDRLSVKRIAEMVVESMGLNGVEYSYTGTDGGWPGDVPRFVLDVRKLSNLGWRVRDNSEQAVRKAIDAMTAKAGV